MSARFAAIVVAAVFATGCIRSATLITVKPDGSGTVEQTVLMNASALKGMLGGFGTQQPGQASNGPSDADMAKNAAKFGEGVTYLSSEPVKTPDGYEGSTAKYAFTDVTKLRINQDPQLSAGSGTVITTPSKSESPLTFALDKGAGLSTLTVTFHDKPRDTTAAKPGGPDMDNPQMMEMMRSMFKGFKVGIDLEVVGKIVKTNADYVQGSRVTLLEMELDPLLENEAKLKEVQKALGPNASVAELKPYLKDIKGLKVNDPVVTISFR